MNGNNLPKMIISLNANGVISINAPLKDKLLCMKMLAQAIILVEEYQEPTILVKAQLPRNMG